MIALTGDLDVGERVSGLCERVCAGWQQGIYCQCACMQGQSFTEDFFKHCSLAEDLTI